MNNSPTTKTDLPPKPLLLTPAEASRELAISPRKLWGLTASGEIPHLKIGRSVRYFSESLRTWILEQQEIQSQRK